MRKIRRLLFLCFRTFLAINCFLLFGFEIHALEFEAKKSKQTNIKKAYFSKTPDAKDLVKKDSAKDKLVVRDESITAPELLGKVKSLEKLMAIDKRPDQLQKIKISLLGQRVQLARAYRFSTGGKSLKPEEINQLILAKKLGQDLVVQKTLPAEKLSYVHYLLGLALLDLNETQNAVSSFQEAIRLNAKAPYCSSVSIYVGEVYFDNQKLDLAEKYYRMFYNTMSAEDKNYVDFKMAWILINTSKLADARKLLAKLATMKSESRIVKDSMQTLAFVVSENSKQDEIIQFVKSTFTISEQRKAFLWAVYLQFQNSQTKARDQIWAELLKYENAKSERAKIWLTEVRSAREQNQFQRQYDLFARMVKDLGESQIAQNNEIKEFLPEIIEESESALSIQLKNYSSNTKNDEIYKQFLSSIDFHLKFGRQLKNYNEVIQLKLDLLYERKDYKNLLAMTQSVLADNSLNAMHDRASQYRADALEVDVTESPQSKYRPELVSLLEHLLKDESRQNWSSISQKLLGLYVQDKKYAEAETLAEKIFAKKSEPTALVSIYAIWYEQNNCQKILADNRSASHEKISEFKRECALKVAEASQVAMSGAANTKAARADYYKNILYFIRNSKDLNKKNVAISDFFKTLKADNKLAQILQFISTEFYPSRFADEISPYTFDAILAEFYAGHWQAVEKLSEGCAPANKCKEIVRIKFLSSVCASQNINRLLWSKQTKELQQYFDNMWPLLSPEDVVRAFKDSKALSADEKKLLFVATRLLDIDFTVVQNKRLFILLKDMVPKSQYPIYDLPSFQGYMSLNWPVDISKHKLSDKKVLALSEQVQKLRKQLQVDLRELGNEQRLSIIKLAIKAEDNMAKTIDASPVPKGLKSEQVNEYKSALAEVSQEFYKTRDDFKKLAGELDSKIRTVTHDEWVDLANFQKIDDWVNWSDFNNTKAIQFGYESKNIKSSMILLDFIHDQKKVESQTYQKARAGLLLSTRATLGIKKYVYDELIELQDQTTIDSWRGLGRRSITKEGATSQ